MQQRFLIVAGFLAATPAFAAAPSLLGPTRDVAVEYRTNGPPQSSAGMAGPMGGATGGPTGGPNGSPTGSLSGLLTIHYSANGLMRIDPQNGRGYVIVDKRAGEVTMVLTEQHLYMQMPRQLGSVANPLAALEAMGATLKKVGTDTVAGIACDRYDTSGTAHTAQICLTDDGLLLRVNGDDGEHRMKLEAVKVTYGEQETSLFEPPADFKKMEVPAMGGAPPTR